MKSALSAEQISCLSIKNTGMYLRSRTQNQQVSEHRKKYSKRCLAQFQKKQKTSETAG